MRDPDVLRDINSRLRLSGGVRSPTFLREEKRLEPKRTVARIANHVRGCKKSRKRLRGIVSIPVIDPHRTGGYSELRSVDRSMISGTVQDIEQAIKQLSTAELDELYAWLADYQPQPIDARIEADFAAGHLEKVLLEVLDDEKNGRFQPL